MSIPSLEESQQMMLEHWDKSSYPALVYVETTNFCNARCTYCLYERMERPVTTMSFGKFKVVANKVAQRGLRIGAMFCFGEPLADKNIFDKIVYARSVGAIKGYLGLNTNCTYLTPEKYDSILSACQNITLSFPHTEKKFEELTKLNWEECYNNAIEFIRYRNRKKPEFIIKIGCNDVTGHDRSAVKRAFKGFRVDWARDAEIKWGSKVITGVIDRSIMYHRWFCDGYKGALQIKPNGDCCFCAYDVLRSETRFANIFENSWEEIEENFKNLWKRPASLCLRCDFWWNYKQMVAGGWKRGKHIDSSWQYAYLDSLEKFWEDKHKEKDIRFLTDSSEKSIQKYFGIDIQPDQKVLKIGLGTGRESRELAARGIHVWGLDISKSALDNSSQWIQGGWTDPKELPSEYFDVAVSHLVAQHMTDIDLFDQLVHVFRSLKENGRLYIQYASSLSNEIYREGLREQQYGLVRRSPDDMRRVIELAGGVIVSQSASKFFDPKEATDDAYWNGFVAKRLKLVKAIGG